MSDRKGAVIDIDIIIAYLLFITTIILMVNYTLTMTAPFTTSIESLGKEKNTITVRSLLRTDFGIDDFSDICNISYINLRRFSVTYEIKGFKMPFTDAGNFSPDSINGSVVFKRNEDELHILTGSLEESKSISVEVTTKSSASVTNISLETGDSFSIEYNDFDNLVVTLSSNVNNGDIDEIIIKPVNNIVSFRINGVDLSNSYIGNLKISDYCGTRGIVGSRTSFNRYGLMSDYRTEYYVKLIGDVWWTD